jgi:ubiquitin fusion degradation protein 1
MVYLPYWMMENMHLNEGDVLHIRSATIPKGSFVKLQPQTTDFIHLSNPKAVLERSLRHYSALSKGETFRIFYNKKKYDIGVVEVRPEGGRFPPGAPEADCIIEADVQVDFEAPADYVEPARPSPPSTSPLSSSPLTKSPLAGPALGDPMLDGDSSDDDAAGGPAPFVGSGFRLDGKPVKARKQSPSSSAAGASLLGGGGQDVRVGVRIGPGGSLGGGGSLLGGGGGRTLSGAPAPASGANPFGGGGGQTLGGGGQTLGGGGQTLGGAGAEAGGGQGGPPASGAQADGFRRLGLAAQQPKAGDDYWSSLGGGNKMR